jgi:hypothetical protein
MYPVNYTEGVQYKTTLQLTYNRRQDYNKKMLWEQGKGVVGKREPTNFQCTDISPVSQNNKLTSENNILLYLISYFSRSLVKTRRSPESTLNLILI